jgi:hypothetical protein
MTSKKPAQSPLCLESLEHRVLLQATVPAVGANTPSIPVAPITAHVSGPTGGPAQPATYPDGTTDQDEGPDSAAAAAQPAPPAHPADARTAPQDQDRHEREHELDGHVDRQLLRDESYVKAVLIRSTGTAAEPPRTGVDRRGPAVIPGTEPAPIRFAPTVPPPGPVHSAAQAGESIDPSGPSTAALTTPNLPASEPTGMLPPAAAPIDPPTLAPVTARAWRDVLLDPLAGVPLRDAVAVNLGALRAEADEFLAHVSGLDPEDAADVGWSELVCLTAGIVLVCGGMYAARPARGLRNTKGPLWSAEEGDER